MGNIVECKAVCYAKGIDLLNFYLDMAFNVDDFDLSCISKKNKINWNYLKDITKFDNKKCGFSLTLAKSYKKDLFDTPENDYAIEGLNIIENNINLNDINLKKNTSFKTESEYINYVSKVVPNIIDLGLIYQSNKLKYGAYNFTDWSYKNWGVKNDVINQTVKLDEKNGLIVISFLSDWDVPLKGLKKIVKKYNLKMFCGYADEGSRFFGVKILTKDNIETIVRKNEKETWRELKNSITLSGEAKEFTELSLNSIIKNKVLNKEILAKKIALEVSKEKQNPTKIIKILSDVLKTNKDFLNFKVSHGLSLSDVLAKSVNSDYLLFLHNNNFIDNRLALFMLKNSFINNNPNNLNLYINKIESSCLPSLSAEFVMDNIDLFSEIYINIKDKNYKNKLFQIFKTESMNVNNINNDLFNQSYSKVLANYEKLELNRVLFF